MALIPVRPKGAAADSPIEYVDEGWLTRWPDDFDLVTDDEIAAVTAAQGKAAAEAIGAVPFDNGEQAAPAPAAAPESEGKASDPSPTGQTTVEQSARGRF